jgi:predicted Zn-dependent protease
LSELQLIFLNQDLPNLIDDFQVEMKATMKIQTENLTKSRKQWNAEKFQTLETDKEILKISIMSFKFKLYLFSICPYFIIGKTVLHLKVSLFLRLSKIDFILMTKI